MRILYLDLDALNPLHLSCYGYERNTSPTIDQIAREGVLCTNVYTPDAPCLPSRTAFYSGRFGIQTGVVGHGGSAAQPKIQGEDRGFRDHFDDQGFARSLQKAGFHTAMISPFGQRHAAWHFYAGFNEIHNTGKGGMEAVNDVMPTIKTWFDDNVNPDKNIKDNWYLHINFWDIHTPYRTPMDYGNPFENEPLPDWMPEAFEKWKNKTGPHSAKDLGMYTDNNPEQWPRLPKRLEDEASLKQWIDGYDIAIRYVDDQIKFMIDQLKAAGIYDDTVIIISADHGENQGELGIYGEHGTADNGTCHIPMIVRWPGQQAGIVDEALHYNVDWAPTVMDMLGKASPEIWDGQSYADTIREGQKAGRSELIVSQCCHVCQRGVRWRDTDATGHEHEWMYVRTYFDGFHLFDQEMLFDLKADPREQHNLAAANPDVCKEGVCRLNGWHDEQMRKMAKWSSDVVDPLWTVIQEGGPQHAKFGPKGSPLPQYLERLEATGRSEGAAQLRERYAAELAKMKN